MTKRAVAVNEKGYRIGESHHNAKLSDADVEMVRQLREEHRLQYAEIAEKFEVSRELVKKICQYRNRCETVARWRFIEVKERKFRLSGNNGFWRFEVAS